MLNATNALRESNTTYYQSVALNNAILDSNKDLDFSAIPTETKHQTSHFIQSPLNYTGAKFKLLSQILPLFPKDISVMVDLCCGGASVGVNVSAKHIILNDKQSELMEILALFKRESAESLLQKIADIITNFGLSDSAKFGYAHYKCDSAKGLSSYNKAGFARLKNTYNADKSALKLFVLIIYAFNNQIRFNAKGEFNLPCGKRDFNAKMQEKLKGFINAMQGKNIRLTNKDFRAFDMRILDTQSLVYIDPPYLLGNAGYNENGAWSETDEKDLYEFMRLLDSKRVKFAFSNVLFHKGKEHTMLKNWLKANPKFHTHFLDFSYQNCNYQTKREKSIEVLVTNFKV